MTVATSTDVALRPEAAIASAFVRARREARALPDFPGEIPADLGAAYAVQEHAIGLWGEPIAGWKVGRINPPLSQRFGVDRLAGPIFASLVWPYAPGTTFDFPVYDGGFAAVEAEYVFRIGRDAAAGKLAWTREEAAALVGAVHLGIETAGSPLASINALGPPVIISDFGNNHGLILGPEIAGGPGRADADLACETFIDGASIGRATAAGIPGGPLESLRFLLENTAARGRPLRAGQLVSTGAVTGVHEIAIGQTCRVAFAGDGEIVCRAVRAKPLDA